MSNSDAKVQVNLKVGNDLHNVYAYGDTPAGIDGELVAGLVALQSVAPIVAETAAVLAAGGITTALVGAQQQAAQVVAPAVAPAQPVAAPVPPQQGVQPQPAAPQRVGKEGPPGLTQPSCDHGPMDWVDKAPKWVAWMCSGGQGAVKGAACQARFDPKG